ncbi:FecR family protein [Cesiribacter sp. SM1]|uniref:FecR family protein n=1 Tax=Cesiribacter sp. SM1 TaxID=2861196 RepID=UPI001CD629EF|nr:FecR family protein [Cesiribacter sp. SM1]
MNSSKFQILLDKYLQGKCTPEEEELVVSWYNKISADDQSQQQEVSEAQTEKRIWNSIQAKVSEADVKDQSNWRNRGWYYSAAAAIILLITFSALFLFLNQDPRAAYYADTDALIEYTNGKEYPQTLVLEDGSEVELQPNSEISYQKKFGASKREVYLKGEAFFRITKDASRPFYVYTEEVTTRVLGTSFLVKAYDEEEEVSVVVRTGKVSVYKSTHEATDKQDNPGQEIILTPNQQVVINTAKEKVERGLIANPKVISEDLSLRMVEYQGASVVEILKAIEKSYGISISYDKEKLSSCQLTTSFTDEGLYERLDIISTAINATYRKTDSYILIESEGCK